MWTLLEKPFVCVRHCQHQCVITHSVQEDRLEALVCLEACAMRLGEDKFLSFLSAQDTPVEETWMRDVLRTCYGQEHLVLTAIRCCEMKVTI